MRADILGVPVAALDHAEAGENGFGGQRADFIRGTGPAWYCDESHYSWRYWLSGI